MSNDEIIAKVGKLQIALRDVNATLFNALEKSIIPLIEHQGDLSGLAQTELARIKGVGPRSAELISKLMAGENIHSIVKNLPEREDGRLGECKWEW
ncbi:MAG: hypothetical protein GXP32_10585 [Kiritimatiellaeota bacterium]|nr:hypothetical protein [Kiritimatiellota bacterium]